MSVMVKTGIRAMSASGPLSPDNDQIADITPCRRRANSGRSAPQQLALGMRFLMPALLAAQRWPGARRQWSLDQAATRPRFCPRASPWSADIKTGSLNPIKTDALFQVRSC